MPRSMLRVSHLEPERRGDAGIDESSANIIVIVFEKRARQSIRGDEPDTSFRHLAQAVATVRPDMQRVVVGSPRRH